MLGSELVVVWLAALAAYGLRDPGTPTTAIWSVAGAVALLCLLALGLLRRPPGIWIGSAVQLLLLASGLVVPMMFVVGAVFLALWVVAVILGGRIDSERAERGRAQA